MHWASWRHASLRSPRRYSLRSSLTSQATEDLCTAYTGAAQCSVMQRKPPADAQIRDLLFWSSAWRSGLGSAGLLRPGGGQPIVQGVAPAPDTKGRCDLGG